MKRVVVGIFVLVFLSFSAVIVHAQISDEEQASLDREFDQARETYGLSLESYNRAHNDYVRARAQYFQFDTLTAQNNAKEATRKMLQERDQVIIDYLEAIRKRILATQGIEQFRVDGMIATIDDEQSWLRNHKDNLGSAGTLEDLVEDSDEAGDRWFALQPAIYTMLSEIPYGRVNTFQERLDEIFTRTREKVIEIRNEERPEYQLEVDKLERIDRMIFETEGRIQRSNDGHFDTRSEIDNLGKRKGKYDREYSDIIISLAESTQELKEASLFMKEILREISTE